MKTISCMNIKGGVGKTITTVNVAAILARDYNRRVLVIDADPQGDTTSFFTAPQSDGDDSGMYALLTGMATCYDEVTRETPITGVDLLPCDSSLFTFELEALKRGGQLGIHAIGDLRDAVIEDDAYDVILIDCPPSFTPGSVAALAASDSVIIPIKLDNFSLRGMAFLMHQIGQLHAINGLCRVAGCLVTHWHNAEYIRQGEDWLKASKVPVFDTHIRRCDKVDESTFMALPVDEHSKTCAAARDYRDFVRELLEKEVL